MKPNIIGCFAKFVNDVTITEVAASNLDSFQVRDDRNLAMKTFVDNLEKLIDWNNITKEELEELGFVEYMSDCDIDDKIASHNAAYNALKDDGKADTAVAKIFTDEIQELESVRGLMLAPVYMSFIFPDGTELISIDGQHITYVRGTVDLMKIKGRHLECGIIPKITNQVKISLKPTNNTGHSVDTLPEPSDMYIDSISARTAAIINKDTDMRQDLKEYIEMMVAKGVKEWQIGWESAPKYIGRKIYNTRTKTVGIIEWSGGLGPTMVDEKGNPISFCSREFRHGVGEWIYRVGEDYREDE